MADNAEHIQNDIRYYFILSLVILALSGLGVVLINTYTNSSSARRQFILNRGLWKFDSSESKATMRMDKAWHWRKLIFAGIMLDSLVMSIAVKLLPINQVWWLCGGIYALWFTFILFYWYFIVVPSLVRMNEISNADAMSNTDPAEINGWEGRSRSVVFNGNGIDNSDSSNDTSGSKVLTDDRRLPMTIVTGFLGSGKTTLIKNILQNTVGMRILVIENEVGDEGIDHELLMQHTKKEDVILMSNGCVCCTVRKDLISTFHQMFKHEAFAAIDWVVIETTGLADPAPVIQSLYMDSACQKHMRLDGVITVVDCKHLPRHLSKQRSGNLPDDNSKSSVNITPAFSVTGRTYAGTSGVPEALLQVSYADVIVMNKIDLVSAIELDALIPSVQALNATANILACKEAMVDIEALLNIKAFDPIKNAALLQESSDDDSKGSFLQFDSNGKIMKKTMRSVAGCNIAPRKGKHNVVTVSIVVNDRPLNLPKFNIWISELLRVQGEDILRLKGILWMKGYEEQFVVHGIHMLFDGRKGEMWSSVQIRPSSKLVFIGINLNSAELKRGFESCTFESIE